MNEIITNSNDIYIYFKIVELYRPDKVLDVGMLLKRFGCISRQAMSREIPQELDLSGIDLIADYQPLIYKVIYNNLYTRQDIELQKIKKYDISFLMRLSSLVTREEGIRLWMATIRCSKIILTDAETGQYYMEQNFFRKAQLIQVEDEKYFLIDVSDIR